MPVRKGLTQLYDAKTVMMNSLANQVRENRINSSNQTLVSGQAQMRDMHRAVFRYARLTACENLWLAVIEQTVFDAYLHATGGNYQSVIWVRDARGYFETDDFDWICEQLSIEPDWVRRLLRVIERLARELRGEEYDNALIAEEVEPPAADKRNTNQRNFDYD